MGGSNGKKVNLSPAEAGARLSMATREGSNAIKKSENKTRGRIITIGKGALVILHETY